jgi:hypothetical protein
MALASPSLAEVLRRARSRAVQDVRVGLPGVVVAYDSATQLADVKPQISDTFEEEDGTVSNIAIPVIVNVPVIFPAGGGMRITFPVRTGDTVWLMFSDRSLDAWLSAGGDTAPADLRRHHLSDAVAIPGLHPNNAAWSDADTSVITLGSDSGAAEFVATAERVLTELNKIRTAFNAHTHVVTGTSATGGPVTGSAATPTSMTTLSAPASSTVKVKG